jgi:hypothetical protein
LVIGRAIQSGPKYVVAPICEMPDCELCAVR